MKRIGALTAVAVLLTTGLAALAGAATNRQPQPLREFEGKVVSVNRDARTFRLHDSERGTKRIRVNRNTRYERVAGLSGLEVGQKNIEVTTRRRAKGAWVAIEVERSGGGGEHGGRDRDDRDDDRDED